MSYSSYPKFVFDIYQDIKKNESNKQEKFVYANRYNSVDRGSYRDATYTVKSGDTLFFIAWISGKNVVDLAYDNNIKNIHLLKIGQILKVHSHIETVDIEKLLKNILNSIRNCNLFFKKIFFLVKKNILFMQFHQKNVCCVDIPCERDFYLNISEKIIHNNWHWPTCGKLIDTFSESERGNRGIDISGKLGQPILAVANGKIVYVGNVLKGYGNLIIIKHEHDYLSAYAHNDMILVSEKQRVKIGDKIATMGNSGTNEIKLHFEIKHKGKSVDPLYYLSKNY